MKLHFVCAGVPQINKALADCNVKCILQSYHYMKDKEPWVSKELLVDSGGFTARMKGVEVKVEDYAEYLNKYKVKTGFNLDTNDLTETLENQKYLEKHTNTYIIPVYHLSDYLHQRDLIDDFIRDYPYISVGGVVGEKSLHRFKDEFYSYVFSKTRDKIMVHGLGITSPGELDTYPWYSVDSTSWLAPGRFGRFSYTKLDKKLARFITKNEHYDYSNQREVRSVQKHMVQVTKLWAQRGVIWDEAEITVERIITRPAGKVGGQLQERRRRNVRKTKSRNTRKRPNSKPHRSAKGSEI